MTADQLARAIRQHVEDPACPFHQDYPVKAYIGQTHIMTVMAQKRHPHHRYLGCDFVVGGSIPRLTMPAELVLEGRHGRRWDVRLVYGGNTLEIEELCKLPQQA
jgi:hypothetical protein